MGQPCKNATAMGVLLFLGCLCQYGIRCLEQSLELIYVDSPKDYPHSYRDLQHVQLTATYTSLHLDHRSSTNPVLLDILQLDLLLLHHDKLRRSQ